MECDTQCARWILMVGVPYTGHSTSFQEPCHLYRRRFISSGSASVLIDCTEKDDQNGSSFPATSAETGWP